MQTALTFVESAILAPIAAMAVSAIGRGLTHYDAKRVICGIISFLMLFLTGEDGFPSPFETYGLGGRNIAMGGAVSAIAEDYTATHYNPAGLAFADKSMMGFGFVYGSLKLRLKGDNPDFDYAGKKPLSGKEHDIDRIRAFQLGGSFPVTKGRLKFLKAGVAVNLPPTPIRGAIVDANEPHFVFFVSHPYRIEIKTCLALKIFSKLSLGGGVEALVDLDFPLKLQFFNTRETFLVGNVNTPPRFAPLAGLKFNLTDSLSLAAVYRGEMQLDLYLDLRITAGGEEFIPPVDFHLINYFKPQEVVLGASYAFKKNWLLGIDVAWMDYSKAKTSMPTYEFEVPDWVRVGLSMVNAPPPEFKDVFVPRIGVEYRVNEHVALRSGYFYKPSPVPDQRGNNNYADSNRHGISAGVG